MEDGRYVDGSIWFYAPNKVAPVFFAVAFAASTCFHIWQCIHYHSWRLTGLLPICTILFTAGFIVRVIGAFDYGNLVKYIVSICLIYGAPPLYELANYYILGRILYYIPYLSPIHPGRVLTTFAFISAIVEGLNSNGASYSANQALPVWKQEIGHDLLKAALLLQILVIVAFIAIAVLFHRRCRAHGIQSRTGVYAALHTLYASEALLTVRTVYRIVEYWSIAQLHYGPGFDPMTISPLVRYEWFFYVFEASLMLCNAVLLNVRHPRRYLPQSTKVYLAMDGETEVVGPGYVDKRHWLVTLVDPFDIWSKFKGRKKENTANFWEEDTSGGRSDGKAATNARDNVEAV